MCREALPRALHPRGLQVQTLLGQSRGPTSVSPIRQLLPPRHVAPGTEPEGLGRGDRSDRKQKPSLLSFCSDFVHVDIYFFSFAGNCAIAVAMGHPAVLFIFIPRFARCSRAWGAVAPTCTPLQHASTRCRPAPAFQVGSHLPWHPGHVPVPCCHTDTRVSLTGTTTSRT